MNGRWLEHGNGFGARSSANWMPMGSWSGHKLFWMGALCPLKRGDGVGNTKVGKGSKVMAVVDGTGLPIGLHVDSAQPHEITLAEPTLQTISVPRQRGRPRTRPKELVADKAYDSADFRRNLRRRGIRPTIPTFERRKRGRPLSVGAGYRQRWKVERCFGWMDNCRFARAL
jgi:transposase